MTTDPSAALLAAVAAAASTAKILELQLNTLDPEDKTIRNLIGGAYSMTVDVAHMLATAERRLTAALTPAVPVPDPRQPSTVEAMLAGMTKALEKSHTLDAIFAAKEGK